MALQENSTIARLVKAFEPLLASKLRIAEDQRGFNLEQYAFGWNATYAVFAVNRQHEPFVVVRFDNASCVEILFSYSQRTDAFAVLANYWRGQF